MTCQGWRWRFFALALFLPLITACGKEHSGWAQFPVAIYADSKVMGDSDARADFEAGMRFWEEKAGMSLFDFKGEWKDSTTPYKGTPDNPSDFAANVLFYQNPWPFGAGIAGRTTNIINQDGIQNSIIMINPGTVTCTGDCLSQPQESSLRKIFTHELGHFLGMNHVEDTANIMNPVLTPGGSLDGQQVDLGALQELTKGGR